MIRGAAAVTGVGVIVGGLLITAHPHQMKRASAPSAVPTPSPTRASRSEIRGPLPVHTRTPIAPRRQRVHLRLVHDWDAVAQCEASGDWSANTGNGFYGGLQFTLSTWHAYGGHGLPSQASRAEQIRVAERVLAGQGRQAWPVCGVRL